MVASLTLIGFGLITLGAATAQNKQGDSKPVCQGPVFTTTAVIDETITKTLITTIGLLPDVTTTVLETTTLTLANDAVCPSPHSKRDLFSSLIDSAIPIPTQSNINYHFRNPHVAPRPTIVVGTVPPCDGPQSATTQTSTRISLVELTRTTSLAYPTARTITTTQTLTATTNLPTQANAASNACPTLLATNSQTNSQTTYTLYSRTCARTLSYANPGNTNPPVTLPIRAKVLACEAAAQCATAARNQGAGYLSFDLHYRFASGWECVMFYGRNTKPEFWDVVDEGVGEGYGYSA